jgi:hypothetical protein
VIPITLGGNELPFVLDTAATHHMFDISLQPQLGTSLGHARLEAGGSTVSTLDVEQCLTPELRLGTMPVAASPSGKSPLFDLKEMRDVLEEDIRGVVGAPFLRDKLVQLDFDHGLVRVSQSGGCVHMLGRCFPLRLDHDGRPCVDNVRVGSHVASFRIATAYTGSVGVHKWLFDALLTDAELRIEGGLSEGHALAGRRQSRQGRLTALALGEFRVNDVMVYEASDNLIGLGFLSRFTVTFDAAERIVYFRASERFGLPERLDQSGLHVVSKGGAFEVSKVRAGSPAAAAGIVPLDMIVKLDGVPCSTMRMIKFHTRLSELTGKLVAVTVQRGNQQLELVLDLQED